MSKEDESIIETVMDRQWVYQGAFLWVEKRAVKLPNGEMGLREVVATRESVAVLPVDAAGTVHLVRQWRSALDRAILEIPAGMVDEGEAPEVAARRECEEEAGVLPGRLVPLARVAHAEGFATGFQRIFLGLDLEVHGRQKLDETEFVAPQQIPLNELKRMAAAGEIVDSKTMLALHLADAHL